MLFHFRLPATHRPLTTLRLWAGLAMIIVSLGACSHWRDSYLKSAVEEATQDDIVAKFGDPWRKKESLLHGGSTWIYRYVLTKSELDPMGFNTLGKGMSQAANSAASILGKGDPNVGTDKPQCFHYLLTFDQAKILKDWVRESCTRTSL